MKSPIMFSKYFLPIHTFAAWLTVYRYLFDPEATSNAHDRNGYFKTGDIARREGKYYFILGRASVDSKYDLRCDTLLC
jgi:acyl-CoA synthetase (AMP-forming)/AMP-acid ligase II